jgi:hypothetical protein
MKFVPLVFIAVLLLMVAPPVTSAASQASFSGTSSAVQSAFVAVQTAGTDGGNITSLVAQLNGALVLVQKASAENSTDPAQASADLHSALAIAQEVQSAAATVGQQGMSARQLQFEISVASSVAIVGVAVALYFYGDKIYRRLWLRMYGGQVVRKVG